MMGSAAFLLVYAAVNAGHLRVLEQTGANAIDRLAVAADLPGDVRDPRPSTPTSSSRRRSSRWCSSRAASFAAEWGYRKVTGRRIKEGA